MIYQFGATTHPTLSEAGGKALSLMRMAQAGLPVPLGFTLAVTFFEPWIAKLQTMPEWDSVQTALCNGDDLTAVTSALKAACTELPFTPEQEEQLTNALGALPDDTRFAVRSSSPEEDLAGASFAGGYTTTLGVTAATLLDAVRCSFASAFDERVFVYKQQHGFPVDQPRIAVIVQQQIDADCAGVGFSLNPLNNDYDEAVIDANWGLGESVVAGMVTPDHVVVDKVSKTIIEKRLGEKETSVYLADNGIAKRKSSQSHEFAITDKQALTITVVLSFLETLYQNPIDIEWAYAEGKLYLLQARPITAYIPLPPEMLTKPGERRIVYLDPSLTEGMTTNRPMMPLTLDWFFGLMRIVATPFIGPVEIRADGNPTTSLLFGAGGRIYINASQLLTIYSLKQNAQKQDVAQMDALFVQLLANLDEERYRAVTRIEALRWESLLRRLPIALWHICHLIGQTIISVLWPEHFLRRYKLVIDKTVRDLKQPHKSNLSLREFTIKLATDLAPIFETMVFPALMPYMYYLEHLEKLFGDGSEENNQLLDTMKMGFAGNEAVDIGIRLYHMAKMLPPADFAKLDHLVARLEKRELPADFLAAWDEFVDLYGLRGPGESELANSRYGDDPRLTLEQMSYMAESDFNPEAMQQLRITKRQNAYQQARQKLTGRKRRRLEHAYKILDLFGPTRDTPKYLWVLDNGAVRRRALQEGEMFVTQGRLDEPEDIFWLTLDEIDAANADPSFDLRQVRDAKKPFYQKLDHVIAFPHIIDSRGRIGHVEKPEVAPNLLSGLGISRGVATGRIKVLHTPREKPVEKGDVLVAYTTDPGWTPLFVNAEAIILEVGGLLQHGGVVAREYGKPCVAGIQGITTTLQDGQLVEVDGTTGVVRLLDE
ncbi:MAG: PEP-utilizing enzyme [Chloroflexales bacterium]|nr:PEP-utilizing enzyme [Chloroflexales bacterium]